MEDVQNGSYLRAGGIWTELNRRAGFARLASIKSLLSTHITRTLYDDSRTNLLLMVNKKIGYKEYLIKRQNEEFTEQLNKQITTVETEINSLLSFVMAFDSMVDLMQQETAGAVDEWYQVKRQNDVLNQLLDAQTERAAIWGNLAHDLHDHILTSKPKANA